MSIVNLMANDVWSDADITRRTEAMVRSEFSSDAEAILNRKVSGALLGAYTMTTEDGAEVQRFNAVTLAASMAGVAARADMALLASAMAVEALQQALDALPDDEENQDQRDALQAEIDTADVDVQQLVLDRSEARNPVAEEEPQ